MDELIKPAIVDLEFRLKIGTEDVQAMLAIIEPINDDTKRHS